MGAFLRDDMELRILVAAAENGIIGNDGRVPWDVPSEFEHYQSTVAGHPAIVGRRTFDHMRPLADSLNLVLTSSDRVSEHPNVQYVTSMAAAVGAAEKTGTDVAYVIGGQGIYEAFLPHVDRVVLSRIHGRYEGDRYFPELGPEWAEVSREDRGEFTLFEYVQPSPRPLPAA
jgi:dihydrofolate reductase